MIAEISLLDYRLTVDIDRVDSDGIIPMGRTRDIVCRKVGHIEVHLVVLIVRY